MKKLILASLLAIGCATVNPYRYEELGACPNFMDDDQRASGTVRCRAACSSEGRDMAYYADNCKCYCQPAVKSGPTHTPAAPPVSPNNQM